MGFTIKYFEKLNDHKYNEIEINALKQHVNTANYNLNFDTTKIFKKGS